VFGQSDSNSPPTSSPSSSSNIIDLSREYYLNQSSDEPKNGSIKVTFYGTSMLLFDDVKTRLLVDAFITYPSGVALLHGREFVEFESS
jgi:hypothetical protein